jgi:CheY-like chemotaxis protein
MKILVVEDQPMELKLADHVLSDAGHDVTRADAAEGALAAIKAGSPDLILLDLWLPGMDGLALAKMLKANPETRDILIVAVTAFPEKFPQAKVLAAGCDAYIGKPLSTRTLPTMLAGLVENAGGQPER